MDASKPTPIEIPAPKDEATLLALYLEGVPLVQIARALQVGVPTVLDFLRDPNIRERIEQYEESVAQQIRLSALAARIPAMATLREVCATDGALTERRRAAAELLRQSRAAEKPAKVRRVGQNAHSTPNPEKITPTPDAHPTPVFPGQARATSSAQSESDSSSDTRQPHTPISDPAPTHNPTHNRPHDSTRAPVGDPAPIAAAPSFPARDHTASWHAFDRVEPGPSASDAPSTPAPAPGTAAHVHTQSDQPIEQSVEQPLLVKQPPTRIPSPCDSICAPAISPPLPDALPVAA